MRLAPIFIEFVDGRWAAHKAKTGDKKAPQGFVWVGASAKMSAWQRRHSRRVCLPNQARGASEEGAPPARRGG